MSEAVRWENDKPILISPKGYRRDLQPTLGFRWRVPPDTTTKRAVLEQAWFDQTGDLVWVPVPTEVVEC